MDNNLNIYDYVDAEKTAYETQGVTVAGNWLWKMFDHVNYSFLMKNGQFPITQTQMGERPNKNIILPILNVAYRTEGFDVKDIELYVDDKDNYHLSFLARKFNEKWALENNFDTFIDEVVEGQDDGVTLVKNVNNKRPEIVPLQQIAFCDQTDILAGTIALKHQYTIDELLTAGDENGWNKNEINRAITDSRSEKTNSQAMDNKQRVPQKSIEVFEVHGTFPESWLIKDGEDYANYNAKLKGDSYTKQIHIITYLKNAVTNTGKTGICLYKGKEKKSIFKAMKRTPMFGRACGRGRVEELFEPQIWTNFNAIHMSNMLKEASKVIQVTTDAGFTTRNNTKNTQGGEVFVMDENKTIQQLNTQPVNIQLFDKANQQWEQHARTTGSASDPALGIDPVSGTPLGTTQTVVAQGQGIHEYQRGRIATFIGEIYRDWILDYLVADMLKGDEWIEELTLDELQSFAETVMTNTFNDYIKVKILNGHFVTEEEIAPLRDQFKKDFMKSNKKFLKIVKGEFASMPMKIKFNIANKQKDLGTMVDKLSNIFKTIFANPQGFMETMKIPGAAKAFNEMLEASGLNQMDFTQMPEQQPQPVAG